MSNRMECIEGGLVVDDRGQIQFCNNFDMSDVKRFYIVSNHESQFVRAWHGHKKEGKYAMVVSGSAIFAGVKIENWDNPNKEAPIQRLVLSAKKPSILRIPAGYAHGFKTLEADTKVMFFSTASLGQSADDDYRFEYDFWNPWDVVPR